MLTIIAKYNGKCSNCKSSIRKGQIIGWDRYCKITVCEKCNEVYQRQAHEHEARNTKAYIDAQENEYFERHTRNETYFERFDQF